jgi:hypothetical protein
VAAADGMETPVHQLASERGAASYQSGRWPSPMHRGTVRFVCVRVLADSTCTLLSSLFSTVYSQRRSHTPSSDGHSKYAVEKEMQNDK